MAGLDTVEMLSFSLKLIGKKTRKNVLISAGKLSDKEKMFPAIEKLSKLNIALYATPGTLSLSFGPVESPLRNCTRSPIDASLTSGRSSRKIASIWSSTY